MSRDPFSCADCAVRACDGKQGVPPPADCPGEALSDADKAALEKLFADPENHKLANAACRVEAIGYGTWCRIEESLRFCRECGFAKIGLATCVGLLPETRKLAKIFRANGFEVYGIACKSGSITKDQMDLDPIGNTVGPMACNPINQARQLNAAGTEMNFTVGLCVGHDALFNKYSEAPVSALIVKDRVTGHNPAAALYLSDGYYKKLYNIFDDTER